MSVTAICIHTGHGLAWQGTAWHRNSSDNLNTHMPTISTIPMQLSTLQVHVNKTAVCFGCDTQFSLILCFHIKWIHNAEMKFSNISFLYTICVAANIDGTGRERGDRVQIKTVNYIAIFSWIKGFKRFILCNRARTRITLETNDNNKNTFHSQVYVLIFPVFVSHSLSFSLSLFLPSSLFSWKFTQNSWTR